jgi:hypothetical protein
MRERGFTMMPAMGGLTPDFGPMQRWNEWEFSIFDFRFSIS